MDLSAWALYLLLALAALGAVALHYRLREPAGRGRGLLIGLRWLALAVLILLLFDPVLPAAGGVGPRTVVLVDASLSMRLPDRAGETRWAAARDEVMGGDLGPGIGPGTPGGGRVLLFGGDVVSAADLGGRTPAGTGSRLEPAVRAAMESGANRLLVVTDGALEDADEALALASRGGASIQVHQVGGAPAFNAGLAEVDAPRWLQVGEEAVVQVAVAAVGEGPDSVTIVLTRDGAELARARVAAPEAGRLSAASLRFTPDDGSSEAVRLDVRVLEEDAEADDDERSLYVRIAEEPAGLVLLSLRPDQEPRFLLPVLERALGVPVRGWLMLPGDRFVRLGTGAAAGAVVDQAEVRTAVTEADALVLHGVGGAAPEWLAAAAESAARMLVFPVGQPAAVPFEMGPPRPGDWYPDPDIPASPVAPLLAGLEPGDAPPLVALRTGSQPEGFWSPLNALLARRGAPVPVVLAGRTDGRRLAIAMGEGYWRWAFSGGSGRQVYDRLWSAVGAWLMEEGATAAAGVIEPGERIVARGGPVRFRSAGDADSIRVRVRPEPGESEGGAESAVDTVLRVREGEAVLGVLPPGHYRFEAAGQGDDDVVQGAGPFTVERYSPEFTRPTGDLEELAGTERDAGGVADGSDSAVARTGRPLRASAWPYVLLVLLLCVEWALRRRWGLR